MRSYLRYTHYLVSFAMFVLVASSFPHAARALTITPIFYDPSNYSHTFVASTLTADTDKSTYYPGQPVTVSGVRPFSATCGNGNYADVVMTIDGYTLPQSSNVTCPYVGVTFCTAYTVQTQQVCQDVCKVGKYPDASTCITRCTNESIKVCNSGATANYSVCNETDVSNIASANPSWYVLGIQENPLNYQYSFTAPPTPGTYQIPITLYLTNLAPPNNVSWTEVNTSLSYTVTNQPACVVSSLPWTKGQRVVARQPVYANDFNTLIQGVQVLWDSAYNAGVLAGPFSNSSFWSPNASHGTVISHNPLEELSQALGVIAYNCPNGNQAGNPPQFSATNPIKAADFNGLRTIIEAYAPKPSTADSITVFSIAGVDASISGTSITATVPYNTNVTSLTPSITISNGATVSPASGVAENFSNPVRYTVTAQDGVTSQTYTVTISVASAPTGGGGGGGGGTGPGGGGGHLRQ